MRKSWQLFKVKIKMKLTFPCLGNGKAGFHHPFRDIGESAGWQTSACESCEKKAAHRADTHLPFGRPVSACFLRPISLVKLTFQSRVDASLLNDILKELLEVLQRRRILNRPGLATVIE